WCCRAGPRAGAPAPERCRSGRYYLRPVGAVVLGVTSSSEGLVTTGVVALGVELGAGRVGEQEPEVVGIDGLDGRLGQFGAELVVVGVEEVERPVEAMDVPVLGL